MATTFTYKAKDEKGKVKKGELSASSQAKVASTLRNQGMTPILIEEKAEGGGLKTEINIPGLSGRVSFKDTALFSRQFATMINAGLSLLRALSILADQSENAAFSKIILEVKSDVEQGTSLSQAMTKHPKAFNELYTSMVKAGEVGGVLDDTLLRLADTLEAQMALKNKIKSAMMYPIAVFGLVVLIVTAMLIFVVPMFEALYADLGGTLPLPTRILLLLSTAITSYWYLVILGSVGVFFAFRTWKNTEAGGAQLDAIKLKIPIFGKLIHKTAIARFAHTMASLTRTGVPILQAMDIVSETAGNAVVARAVQDVKFSVSQGESMAEPLANHPVFPTMVVQMIAVGEETGALDTMLEKVGDFYDAEVEAMVEGLTSLIEPLLIVLLGATVGGMLMALYIPMFKIVELVA